MEIIKLDLDNVTEEQLLEAISKNNQTVRIMSSEITKLKQIGFSSKSIYQVASDDESYDEASTIEEDRPTVDESFEETIKGYYSGIKGLTPEQLLGCISEVLPSQDDYQFERIINRLSLEVLRNIKEIKDYIATEDLSSQEISELEEEICAEEEKISVLQNYLTQEVLEPKEETVEENTIIFVPTSGGNIRVLDELERIAPEYYGRFYELLQSIKNGTFKNDQRQRRNSNLTGVRIVRNFNTRVAYTRLNKNTYAVITAYIKKADSDKATTSSLVSKYSDYQSIEGSLIANLDNEEFMSLNKQYEQEIFTRLSQSSEKTSPNVKRKVGDQ